MQQDDAQCRGALAVDGVARLAALVAERLGLHFPESRQRDLLRAAEALAREAGRNDAGAYLQSLVAAPLSNRQMEILTAHLTVVETYFFREMKSLEAFRNHVIPDLLRQRAGSDQRLRIWSAGCSTGEEAYSIAMLLSELIPDREAWDIHILATDVNPQSLDKARRGVYTEWSFRGVPESVRERYFKPDGPKTFAVRSRFRDMISFDRLNLALDAYPSLLNDTNAMDVIFCRNVMMYLVPELVRRVVGAFHHCLVEGGWLVVAPVEDALIHGSGFASVAFDEVTLYRKLRPGPPVVAAAPPPPRQADPAPIMEAGPGASPAASSTSATEESGHDGAPAPDGKRSGDAYEAALAAYQAGRYDEAAAALRSLLDTDAASGAGAGGDGPAFALMARIEANLGRLEQAAAWSQKAVAADKVNPRFCYLLATILDEQHRPAEAGQMLKRALYLDPSFILAHYTLGTIALREQGRNAADRHFLNAAALLARQPRNEVLPEADGMTAGRMLEVIETMMNKEGLPS